MFFSKFISVFCVVFSSFFIDFLPVKSVDNFNVMRVIDGDTFVVADGSPKGVKVRLIGVDAPETRNSGKRKIGFYGKEAKEYLHKLIDGKQVRLAYDAGKRDRYGRLLAYVYVGNLFINADLVKKGYAQVYTVPPNVKYAELFVELEREARQGKRGLWRK